LGSRRERDWSNVETSCEPTKEEVAAAADAREREAAREAEARRDAYITGGTDEGGQSKRASSDPSTTQPWTSDSQRLRNLASVPKYDFPIQSDPYGNALVSALAGGIVAGVGATAAKSGLEGVSVFGRAIPRALLTETMKAEALGAEAFAGTTVKSVVGGAVKSAAKQAAIDAIKASIPAGMPEASAASGPTEGASPIGEGGQSSGRATSRVAPEPNRSEAPRIPEALPPLVRIHG